ncbi:MAG: LysR family transcriptional regulator [SAR116 cluster bacterium]|nr:LysR family transcriptional regulator [SAR116 cluster bacterium]RPG98016.1 MAG: LysR family transcriptional regulator [Candidatus Puniceispirillum sp. TMED176]
MRYAQIRAFHHVALCGGVSRAAESLGLSQPALSEQVRQLEASYDLLLFRRQNRRAELTDSGQELFRLTSRFFEGEAAIAAWLDGAGASLRGSLRIMVDSTAHATGPLRMFRAQHQHVRLDISHGNSREVLAALRAYEVEIGIFGSQPDAADLMMVELGLSPIIAIAGPDAFTTPPDSMPVSRLADFPLIFREQGSETQALVMQAARQAGVKLKPAIVAEGREAVRDLVAEGFGIGFVAESEIGNDTRLRRIRLEGVSPSMPETLAHLSARRDVPVIRSFMRTLAKSDIHHLQSPS